MDAKQLKNRVDNLTSKIDKMLSPEQQANEQAVATMVVTLKAAAVTAHILHLKTRSFAQHMALGTLYEELPGLVDGYAEAYQGEYGLIQSYPNTISIAPNADPLEFVQQLDEFVDMIRAQTPQDSNLQNEIDSICTLLDSTAYKLRFLA